MGSNQSIAPNLAANIDVTPLVDKVTGALKTGLTSVKMKVRRKSDGFVLDWSDLTFKAVGTVVTLLSPAFVEFSAAAFPGEYSAVLALDTLVPPNTLDTYQVTVVEDGTDTVDNLPQVGEVRVDNALADAVLARQALYNDHDLTAGGTDNLELKADNGVTPLARWNVKDKNGNAIALDPGVPAIRERTL
jgi:hypothetical protein